MYVTWLPLKFAKFEVPKKFSKGPDGARSKAQSLGAAFPDLMRVP